MLFLSKSANNIYDTYIRAILKDSQSDYCIFSCSPLDIYKFTSREKKSTIPLTKDLCDTLNRSLDPFYKNSTHIDAFIHIANNCSDYTLEGIDDYTTTIHNHMRLYFENEDNEIVAVMVLFNSKKDYNSDVVNLIKHYYNILSIYIDREILNNRIVDNVNTSLDGKGMFLANMSHEIRTPLNGIVGSAQLLSSTTLSLQQKKFVATINQCGLQLLQIINDILDYTKLTTNKMSLIERSTNLQEIFEIVEKTLHYKLDEKKMKVKFVADTHQDFKLDKQKLIQIIVNLYSNAIKFSEEGTTVIVRAGVEGGENLVVSVKDYGIGISEEDQQKLFKSFSQINYSYSREHCGTGLGLAISEKLCKLMKGWIKVQSTLEFGSIFTFSVKYNTYNPKGESVRGTKDYLSHMVGKNVLIVDDNSTNRMCLTHILLDFDIVPISCSNAAEAIKLIKSDYDIYLGLIDIKMPKVDGFTLAEKIKELRPRFPMVAISSVEDVYIQSPYFEHMLVKPIREIHLLDCFEMIVTKYKEGMVEEKGVVEEGSKPNSRLKILIAEDTESNVMILVEMLGILKYTNLKVVKNGGDAIREIGKFKEDQENQYDVILLDLKMPVKSGYDVAEYVRGQQLVKPEIIVMTASVLQFEKDRCKELGIHRFIDKPLNLHDVRNTLTMI
jgi:signal transduction histidine kinase/DNA-binding response OmpR family regulator